MAQTATSYYRGIFKPPASPNGVQNQGCIADVTGAVAPTTAASVTYTPMSTTGVDQIYIDDQVLTVSYNSSAAQTVTDAKSVLKDGVTVGSTTASAGLVGSISKYFLVSGTSTLIFTAKAPGTAGEGVNVRLVHVSGAGGSLNRGYSGGASRWFGQGVGAGPVGGALLGGCGALQTGIGYGTQMRPVAARVSSNVGTDAATVTWTPPTSSTATLSVAGQNFTITFNSTAAQTVTDSIAMLHANPKVAREVVASNDGSDGLLLTANKGLDGNNIQVSCGGENGSSLSAATFTGGAGPTVTDVSSAQVGAGLDAQSPVAFTALRMTPTGDATQGDTGAGTVQAVGANDAVLVTSSCTYTPPTSSTDFLYINGVPLSVLTAGGSGTVGAVNFDTNATTTVTNCKAAIEAIPWLNNLLVVGGTTTLTLTSRYKDTTPGTPVAGLGPWGNYVTIYSAGLHSASVNHADLTGGATSGKGVRLVLSTGTVANGGAVITGWLNEFNPGATGNPNTGSIDTGFVVTGRAS